MVAVAFPETCQAALPLRTSLLPRVELSKVNCPAVTFVVPVNPVELNVKVFPHAEVMPKMTVPVPVRLGREKVLRRLEARVREAFALTVIAERADAGRVASETLPEFTVKAPAPVTEPVSVASPETQVPATATLPVLTVSPSVFSVAPLSTEAEETFRVVPSSVRVPVPVTFMASKVVSGTSVIVILPETSTIKGAFATGAEVRDQCVVSVHLKEVPVALSPSFHVFGVAVKVPLSSIVPSSAEMGVGLELFRQSVMLFLNDTRLSGKV